MAKQIIDDTVMENVEILEKLALTEEERKKAKEKMQEMLDYVDKLNELDTDGIEPLSHTFSIGNVFREDVVKPSLDRELALSNAPQQEDGYFRVPKILEE